MRDVLTQLFIAGFATIALIASVSSNAQSLKAQTIVDCGPYERGGWCQLACEWRDPWWCPEFLCPSHWDCENHFFITGVAPCDATCVNQ